MGSITIPFMGKVVASSASVLAFSLSSYSTHLMIHSSSFFRCFSTRARYHVIHSSFVSYSYWICSTISWQLLMISNLVVANIRVRSSLTSIASYFASLLENEKQRWIVCYTSFPVDDCRSRPTPDLDTLDAPSTWNIHHCFLGRSIGCGFFFFMEFNYKFGHNLSF